MKMTYDHATEVYVPCVYALMIGKHEYLFSVVLHEVVFLMKLKWMPKFITTDFEIALIKAIKYEFTETILKLQKFIVSDTESNTILKNIKLVALVPTESINHTIQYIKSLLFDNSNLDIFFNYFNSTWLKKYEPSHWNINKVAYDTEFIGRTNNSIERYNRRLSDKFSRPHSKFAAFTQIIKEEFLYYEEKCCEIREKCLGNKVQTSNTQ
ncbi:hypothetical protein HZS_6132 [Henneguya salminicola]|nr:hypothetical protein HZS_6132 [Henneguya salminicola]